MKAVLYHNPRCSKSRQALALLEERGVEVTVVRYLDEPPTENALAKLLQQLGCEAHAMLRPKEGPYKELGLSPTSARRDILRAIATHPILLERPIAVVGERAVIGRPPEAVLGLLS